MRRASWLTSAPCYGSGGRLKNDKKENFLVHKLMAQQRVFSVHPSTPTVPESSVRLCQPYYLITNIRQVTLCRCVVCLSHLAIYIAKFISWPRAVHPETPTKGENATCSLSMQVQFTRNSKQVSNITRKGRSTCGPLTTLGLNPMIKGQPML